MDWIRINELEIAFIDIHDLLKKISKLDEKTQIAFFEGVRDEIKKREILKS